MNAYKRSLCAVSVLICWSAQVMAQMPSLKLPFEPGESWGISTGYGGSSTHSGNQFFALDFNLPGEDDFGKSILTAAFGEVETITYSSIGFGNNVMINHGNGWMTRYSHLQTILVSEGELVIQGWKIGTCGSTGNSTGSHLDFTIYYNGVSVKPEPMSCYVNFVEGGLYTSDNYGVTYPTASQFQPSWNESQHGFAVTPLYQWGSLLRQDFQYTVMTFNPAYNTVIVDGNNWVCPGMTQAGWNSVVSPYFVQAYNNHGRANVFGQAFSDAGNPRYAHLWGEYWIQNFNGGSLGECALMFDASQPVASKQTAPIHGALWNWFRYHNGPYYQFSDGTYLGCPIEPEQYANPGVNFDVYQNTSNGYLFWDEWTVTANQGGTFHIAGGSDDPPDTPTPPAGDTPTPTPTPWPTPTTGLSFVVKELSIPSQWNADQAADVELILRNEFTTSAQVSEIQLRLYGSTIEQFTNLTIDFFSGERYTFYSNEKSTIARQFALLFVKNCT